MTFRKQNLYFYGMKDEFNRGFGDLRVAFGALLFMFNFLMTDNINYILCLQFLNKEGSELEVSTLT